MFEPPTDSLYKFMAISGLLMVGFGVGYPFSQLIKLEREAEHLRGEMERLKIETRYNDKDVDALEQETESLKKDIAEYTKEINSIRRRRTRLADAAITEIDNRLTRARERLLRKADASRERLKQIELTTADLEANSRMLSNAHSYIKALRVVGLILAPFGLFWQLVGFLLWWHRIQSPLDKILKRDADTPRPAERTQEASVTSLSE
jgi:hypothetical protein